MKLLQFLRVKADELRQLACSIFLVDFDQAVDEEVLLFRRACLPVVRLLNCDHETNISGTLFGLLFLRRIGYGGIV